MHLLKKEKWTKQAIRESIAEMEKVVQSYVPGYHLRTEPIFDGNKVTVIH